jgi:hypothetical protein
LLITRETVERETPVCLAISSRVSDGIWLVVPSLGALPAFCLSLWNKLAN